MRLERNQEDDMFELFVQPDIQDSVVSLSWCLKQDTLAALGRDYGLKNPHLMIAVIPEKGGKGTRQVVSLKDSVAPRVELAAPGRNRIYAFVLSKGVHQDVKNEGLFGLGFSFRAGWGNSTPLEGESSGDGEFRHNLSSQLGFAPEGLYDWRKRLNKMKLREDFYNSFSEDVLQSEILTAEKSIELEIENWEPPLLEVSDIGAYIDVEVPEGVFASEPHPLEKAWVNWIIDSEADNQCNFRRRRLWAYTGQLFVVFPVIYLVRLMVALVLLLLLHPGVSLNSLLHPLTYDSEDIWDNMEMPFWKKCKGTVPLFPFVALTPLGIILLGVLGLFIGFIGEATSSLLMMALCFFIPITVTLVLLWLAVVCMMFLPGLEGVWNRLIDLIDRDDENWWADENVVNDLACTRERKQLTFKDLPKHKRTVWLRYENLKAKVCRPYAKR